ncbi:LysR substrate-binding domain-containing protein [Bradyrhizobium yuanmingense]|uniref:LysR substrate-binding domain-containing protein n=1 Tax=Bradyrhizobium yuanmingense TaxID=108015 RepID=UPI0034DFE345
MEIEVLEQPKIVALPGNHPIAKRGKAQSISLASLANDPFILIGPQGTGLHDETIAACRAAGFMPKLGQPAPRITSTLSLVAAGLGIAVIPATMQSVRIAGIVYRRLQAPVPKAFLGPCLPSQRPIASAQAVSERGDVCAARQSSCPDAPLAL